MRVKMTLEAISSKFKKQIELMLIRVPFLRKATLFILSTKRVDELCEQCLVDFWLRKHKQESKSDFSVIDIGAGPPPTYYEIYLKYTNHVYCVEPVLDMQNNPYGAYVKKLIEYSRRGKVTLFQGVISEKSGIVTFWQGKGSASSNSSLDPSYRIESVCDPQSYLDSFEKTTVESKTYQEYVVDNNIRNLFLVKIDCEGAEGKILTTMNKSNAPKILLQEIAYDTGELKEQIHRLVCQEGIFHDSLFIVRKSEDHNFDVLGEFRFNEHLKFLGGESDFTYGTLILATSGMIQREEILRLRRETYSRLIVR
jgi:FkbM family methyltransferase